MRILTIILLALSFSFISCGDTQDEESKDYQSIDAITGLRLIDANGQPLGLWRDPNDKPTNVFAFPNPNNGAVFIFSEVPMENIWILNGDCFIDSMNTDIITLSQSLEFESSDIDAIDIQQYPVDNATQLTLNLSDLTKGFYRLFVQLNNGEINWQNIYIDPQITTFVDLSELDAACN